MYPEYCECPGFNVSVALKYVTRRTAAASVLGERHTATERCRRERCRSKVGRTTHRDREADGLRRMKKISNVVRPLGF